MIPGKKERKVTEDGNWQKKRRDGRIYINVKSDITARKKKEATNDVPAMNTHYHINDV
jgi:hypothetical protein